MTKPITIRFSGAMLEALTAEAEAKRGTVADVVRDAVAAHQDKSATHADIILVINEFREEFRAAIAAETETEEN